MGGEDRSVGVAIVGCGTVGGAAAEMLTRDRHVLAEHLRAVPELRAIVDVDFTHAAELGLDEGLFSTDFEAALADDGIGVVVELIGGTTIARRIVERALRAGKSVVTANKALLAHHGASLLALARQNGVCLAFEASCAGGVPIVRAICGGLVANRIDAIYGIVNGTCNYILTAMTESGRTYAEALAEAQAAGLAEANPTLDVAGIDSAHKLAILAALAFGRRIDFDAVHVAGIDSLDLCDINYGRELGYVVKLLAIAHRQADGLSLCVRPVFISTHHPLAWVSGPFNAVSVYGHAIGHTMYYGRGAGGRATASAIVADVVSVALGTAQRAFDGLKLWPDLGAPAVQLPIEAARSRYYLRVTAEDRPGVFAKIAAILGDNDISISSALQHEPPTDSDVAAGVPVVVTTHDAVEGRVRNALEKIDKLDVIKAKTVCIGIVDEHPEMQ